MVTSEEYNVDDVGYQEHDDEGAEMSIGRRYVSLRFQ